MKKTFVENMRESGSVNVVVVDVVVVVFVAAVVVLFVPTLVQFILLICTSNLYFFLDLRVDIIP